MSKSSTVYVCCECGGEAPRWAGQCKDCKEWNTLVEQHKETKPPTTGRAKNLSKHWAGAKNVGKLMRLSSGDDGDEARISTGIAEFDRVLGGAGVMPGSIALIGGEPGVGKSTLLLQAIANISANGDAAVYVTGEESTQQVSSRARRLGVTDSDMLVISEVNIKSILEAVENAQPQAMVVDSIQTMYNEDFQSAAGSVSQIRECAQILTRYSKQTGCAIFLVGHVTKGGAIAGPRVLEHLVDTVLYFDGDTQSQTKLLRSIKNRFGAAQELGAFEMTSDGLISVDNPSALFIESDREASPGSCIFVMQDGPRPMLIEMQALIDDTSKGNPQRCTVGVDHNRVAMLLAILHKHGNLDVNYMDTFVNAVGGIKITETASDLPTFLAMISSFADVSLPASMASFGEIGLNGEVRGVQNARTRIKEAVTMGYETLIIPKKNVPKTADKNINIIGIKTIAEAVEYVTNS